MLASAAIVLFDALAWTQRKYLFFAFTKRRQHVNLHLILTVVKTVYFHDSRTGEIACLELKMLFEGCFCSHATKYLM